jgi:hypothetical protein
LLTKIRYREIQKHVFILRSEARNLFIVIEKSSIELAKEGDLIGLKDCRALVKNLHITLPRELRDMVYDHLLDSLKGQIVRRKLYNKPRADSEWGYCCLTPRLKLVDDPS